MSHYFDEQQAVRSDRRTVTVTAGVSSFEIVTDRGVFSHGSIDAGTAVLLRVAGAPPPAGTLLDLGCGAGVLAIAMALAAPDATIIAVDVNARALELCRENAARNHAPNVVALTPEAVDPSLRFETIWSNPPIRIGKQALHDLLANWLARLAPRAAATLVVQRHLGADSLHRWLESAGWPTARIASSKGYRVLRVEAR